MYSGTGTALFDWIKVANTALDFSMLVDTGTPENFERAARFCCDHDVRLYPSRPRRTPGCPDAGAADAARVLRSRAWDYVECVSWASAATNLDVLLNRPAASLLLYTPHAQPLWTLPTPWRYGMVERTFKAMLAASDLVCVDTPRELAEFDPELDDRRVAFVPLGVDTERFQPAQGTAPPRRRLLSVADFGEHRKRADLLLEAMAAVAASDVGIDFVLIGKGSGGLTLPPGMAQRTCRLGYVAGDMLVDHYREAGALMLLSDFEAFGLPIAEALCCGTPVIATRLASVEDVFGDLPGVHLVDNRDPRAVRDTALAVLGCSPDRQRIAHAAGERFALDRTYGRKLARVLGLREGRTAREAC